jgi:hypothetical protein
MENDFIVTNADQARRDSHKVQQKQKKEQLLMKKKELERENIEKAEKAKLQIIRNEEAKNNIQQWWKDHVEPKIKETTNQGKTEVRLPVPEWYQKEERDFLNDLLVKNRYFPDNSSFWKENPHISIDWTVYTNSGDR